MLDASGRRSLVASTAVEILRDSLRAAAAIAAQELGPPCYCADLVPLQRFRQRFRHGIAATKHGAKRGGKLLAGMSFDHAFCALGPNHSAIFPNCNCLRHSSRSPDPGTLKFLKAMLWQRMAKLCLSPVPNKSEQPFAPARGPRRNLVSSGKSMLLPGWPWVLPPSDAQLGWPPGPASNAG